MWMWPPAQRRKLGDFEGAAQRSRRQPANPTPKTITSGCPNVVKHDVGSPTAEAARDPKSPMRTGRVLIAEAPM
jgi:hypothetical protein